MGKPNLSPQIALQIVDHIRAGGFTPGQHLPTQVLADSFKVSRAPVTAALKLLEDHGIVRSEPNRGFFLAKDPGRIRDLPTRIATVETEDETYFAIAEDRLSGALPDRISENELMRLYGVPRGRLLKILHRIADEGWAERLPGHGWEFRAVISSRESHEQAYRFRTAIETSAVMEPSFRIDRAAFAAARRQQQALVDGDVERLSRAQLFRINAGFHEMIVGCAGNPFFLDALRRINRLRRLIVYRATIDRDRVRRQCREHLEILDRLERGDMPSAAAYLRIHIEGARRGKAKSVT